ncbi:MAG TPA: SDR family oxidoreductase, partial [bacterium]
MELRLKGKRAIVTGATRGIGRAIAETFAAEGVHLAICSRTQAGVDEAVAALKKRGVTVHGGAFDARDGAKLRSFIGDSIKALGGVDIFVHNVSGWGGTDEEAWRTTFEVDMMGAVRGVESVVPAMKQAGGGAIVFISTTAATETFLGARSYNAVKAGLIVYSKSLARELGSSGSRVNTVSPGPVLHKDGPWDKRQKSDPAFFEKIRSEIPLGRYGKPEDVANGVVFLCSPAAAFTSGTNMIVDGAFTHRVQF